MFIFYLFLSSFSIAICSNHKIQSAVLELNDKFYDVRNEGYWFIEFYAPWCGHCKKLHPTWEQLGNALSDTPIKVGRLDCTRFTDVASKLSVNGFPTIKFFRNGVEYTYEGDRSKEAMTEYALKLHGPEFRVISDGESFQKFYNEYYMRGFFLLVAGVDDNSTLKNDYRNAAKEMFAKSYFFETALENLPNNISLTEVPSVLAFKDLTYYIFDEKSELSLQKWLETERWPLMPLVTYGNLYEIGLCCDKLLVLSVLDLADRKKAGSPVKKFDAMVRSAAKDYYQELHSKFQFGWLDGDEIANGIAMRTMPVPSLMVFNVSTYQFYIPEDIPDQITKDSLALYLQSIVAGTVPAQGGKGFVQRIKRAGFEFYSAIYNMFATQPLLACCLFGLPLGILSVICYTLCSSDVSIDREEIYKDSDDTDDSDHDKRD